MLEDNEVSVRALHFCGECGTHVVSACVQRLHRGNAVEVTRLIGSVGEVDVGVVKSAELESVQRRRDRSASTNRYAAKGTRGQLRQERPVEAVVSDVQRPLEHLIQRRGRSKVRDRLRGTPRVPKNAQASPRASAVATFTETACR